MSIPTEQGPIFRFPAIATLRFEDVTSALPVLADLEDASRVAIVTSSSQRTSQLIRDAEASLGARHAITFTAIRAHSPYEDVLACAAALETAGAQLIIAVGGGSVIDAAKVVQLCLGFNLTSIEKLAAFKRQAAIEQVTIVSMPRVVAVPTTLSSAEFTPFAGVTDLATGRKDAFEHPMMVPKHIVFDAKALLATPAAIVVASGARSVDHCVETLLSTVVEHHYNAVALAGLKLLWRHLPALASGDAGSFDGDNLLRASWMAISGPAAGVPVGASHAIGRVLGAVSGVQHGHTSAILLPAVLRWNAVDRKCQDRQNEVSSSLGFAGGQLASSVRGLFDVCGLPTSLSEAGVAKKDLARIAEHSVAMLKHHTVAGNARPISTAMEVREILELAW